MPDRGRAALGRGPGAVPVLAGRPGGGALCAVLGGRGQKVVIWGDRAVVGVWGVDGLNEWERT
jgi:hypothetical protein